MILYELCFLIAMFGFVYTNILTEADMIFGGLYRWLNMDVFKNDKRKQNHPLFMIIIGCEKCFCGQVALWWYLLNMKPTSLNGFLLMFFFVSFTILLANLFAMAYQIIKKHT